MQTFFLLLLGFVLLVGGGELLVRGAVSLAERLGLSPMLVGLTVVGLGTSMPELATSVQAALQGSPGIAIGNIVGSNIANTLLILGAAALLAPMAVERLVLWRDGMVGLAGVAMMIAAGCFSGLTVWVGSVFIAVLGAYIGLAYAQERRAALTSAASLRTAAVEEADPAIHPDPSQSPSLVKAIALFVAGSAVVIAGGTLLVDAAIALASALGVSDTVFGLTVVAAGTSFPELVTTIVAALRKQSAIALGNVLGSNIYNIFFIGGITGIVAPGPIPTGILTFDMWVLLGASAIAMLFAWTGGRLGRREGATLIFAYIAFLVFTVMGA